MQLLNNPAVLLIGIAAVVLFWPTISAFFQRVQTAQGTPVAVAGVDVRTRADVIVTAPSTLAAVQTIQTYLVTSGMSVDDANKLLKPILPHLLSPAKR